jgi:hypothetical protein
MNFAFSSVIIILLILPGFIFSLELYNSDEPFHYSPLTYRTILSLFVSIIFLLIWTPLFVKISHCQINYSSLIEIIGGKNNDQLLQTITSTDLLCFSFYIISIYLFSYSLGCVFNFLVKKFKLDAKFNLLRLESPWYYLLKGYEWEIGEPDLIIITAAVELAGKAYLYNGYLENYYLDKNGELDRLILTDTRRRGIENDHLPTQHGEKTKQSIDGRFYTIDGHNFVLKYSNIKSLNIQFLKIDQVSN